MGKKCPFCDSSDIAVAMMGIPAYSWELGKRLENYDSALIGRGEANLGTAYRCNNCGRSFTDGADDERK